MKKEIIGQSINNQKMKKIISAEMDGMAIAVVLVYRRKRYRRSEKKNISAAASARSTSSYRFLRTAQPRLSAALSARCAGMERRRGVFAGRHNAVGLAGLLLYRLLA